MYCTGGRHLGARCVPSSASEGALELRLRHLGAAPYVSLLGLLEGLVTGRPAPAVLAPIGGPALRRDVGLRELRRLAGLAAPGPRLVDGARRDLPGLRLRNPALL